MVECLSSNHTLNDVSLCIEKRKPSDVLAERAFLKTGRGDWPNFEPRPKAIQPFVAAFSGPSEPHLLTAARLGRHTAA
jgi:hypothetical protein